MGKLGKPVTQRQLRVGEMIKQALSMIFLKDEAKLPNVQTKGITVTEVRMSPDLKTAKTFVLPLGGINSDETVENLKEFELTELDYQEGQTRIKVSKASKSIEQVKTSAVVSPNKSVLKSLDEGEGTRVKSPIIGTAYLAPEPGAKKFVEVGDKIKKGQTIMIVEAMKTMNHVPSSNDGVVKKILVNDGQPVEFGQSLIILK